jgi:hypothetical protein
MPGATGDISPQALHSGSDISLKDVLVFEIYIVTRHSFQMVGWTAPRLPHAPLN